METAVLQLIVVVMSGALAAMGLASALSTRNIRRNPINQPKFKERIELAHRVGVALAQREDFKAEEVEQVLGWLINDPLEARERNRAAQKRQLMLVTTLMLTGTLGMLATLVALFSTKVRLGSLQIVTSAYAQAADQVSGTGKADIAWMLPWVFGIIMVVMAAAFMGSMWVVLTTQDTPENQSKLKGATDIVKTFGGFFTGIATTLLH